jgi:UTP:GlnB (protein PII) uridylyltransferase
MPTRQDIARFLDSMPARYARDFEPAVIAQHAAAWSARGDRITSVSHFSSQEPSEDALCLIADDRPGLLSMFAAAFVSVELDVIAAKAYTRHPRGRPAEAVDLFWVRRAGRDNEPDEGSIEDMGRLLARLTEILQDPAPMSNLSVYSEPGVRASSSPTLVRFIEGRAGTLSTLEIETEDRFGLLLAMSRAVYEQRAAIESCEVRTKRHRVFDVFSITELDGSPISAARRLEIQVAVMSAIEAK